MGRLQELISRHLLSWRRERFVKLDLPLQERERTLEDIALCDPTPSWVKAGQAIDKVA